MRQNRDKKNWSQQIFLSNASKLPIIFELSLYILHNLSRCPLFSVFPNITCPLCAIRARGGTKSVCIILPKFAGKAWIAPFLFFFLLNSPLTSSEDFVLFYFSLLGTGEEFYAFISIYWSYSEKVRRLSSADLEEQADKVPEGNHGKKHYKTVKGDNCKRKKIGIRITKKGGQKKNEISWVLSWSSPETTE